MSMKPCYETTCGKLYHGHVVDVLGQLRDRSVNCCVTSPPYWGLRDYGVPPQVWGGDPGCRHDFITGEIGTEIGRGNWSQASNGRGEVQGETSDFREPIRSSSEQGFCKKCGAWLGSHGLEPTPELYIEHEVLIFREVRRVLCDDGTCWINLGDSYAASRSCQVSDNLHPVVGAQRNLANGKPSAGFKQKDLMGIPWRVVFALQADGWYLRSALPWVKRTAMPESVKDRPTSALEYVFMLTKSQHYRCDMKSIKVQASPDTHRRYARGRSDNHKWKDGGPGNQTIAKSMSHMIPGVTPKSAFPGSGVKANSSFHASIGDLVGERNFRNTDLFFQSLEQPFGMIVCGDEIVGIDAVPGSCPDAHFAAFSPSLVEPCIMAGCPVGGVVLDPFVGSGTTAIVAHKHDRKFIGIDLSKTYLDGIAIPRIEAATAQLKLFA